MSTPELRELAELVGMEAEDEETITMKQTHELYDQLPPALKQQILGISQHQQREKELQAVEERQRLVDAIDVAEERRAL